MGKNQLPKCGYHPMRIFILLLSALFSIGVMAGEFDQPWNDSSAPLVIDPFHGNSIDWEQLSTEPRVVAVIHKATIGTKKIDSAYFERKSEAKKRGYLWGSYHWGLAGDPAAQADFYIDTVKPESDELIALDLEDATSTKLMNIDEALIFIRRVKERIGRFPVLYTNHSSAALISAKFKISDFVDTPLWYARFKRTVDNFPKGVWPTYTLWQFSSEINPQLAVPGTRSDMDINVFNGSVEKLKANWPLTKAVP